LTTHRFVNIPTFESATQVLNASAAKVAALRIKQPAAAVNNHPIINNEQLSQKNLSRNQPTGF